MLYNCRLCFIYILLLHSLANSGLGLPVHNLSLSDSSPLIKSNISSPIEPRFPSFRFMIHEGNAIVNEFLYGGTDYGLVRKAVNSEPFFIPTFSLNEFTELDMEFIINQRQAVKLVHKRGLWDSFKFEFEQGYTLVSHEIAHLRFNPSDFKMDETKALSILNMSGRLGPWSVIQLCKMLATGRIAYAFADFIRGPGGRRSPEDDPELVWTLVDVLDETISLFVGDPCSDTLPDPVAQANGTMTQSPINNLTLPISLH